MVVEVRGGVDDGFDIVIVGGPNLGGDRKLFAFGWRSALGAEIKLPGEMRGQTGRSIISRTLKGST